MVFYFTATGNSLYVAESIDKNAISIPQVINEKATYTADKIGIVCPVYCGEIPHIVKRFLVTSKLNADYIFLILTYGASASDCPQKAIVIKHEKNKNERYINENLSLDEIIKSNFQDRKKDYE